MKKNIFSIILQVCLWVPKDSYLQILTPDSLIIQFYKEQVIDLSGSRGLSAKYIYPEDFQKDINSIEDYAQELQQFYYGKDDVCFLLFFHKNNTLTRYFLEPGKVIEKVSIKISAKEMLSINEDVYRVMQLGKLTAGRSPIKREVKLGETSINSKPLDPQKVMQKARDLLLPKQFSEKYQHLIIVPSLNIGSFPFSLLKPYDNDNYLIDICSVAISPGLFDLLAFNVYNAHGREFSYQNMKRMNFLLISNPEYPTNTMYHFPDLPGAKMEIEQILSVIGKYKLLEGKDATKELVLKTIKDADVVYFATHGIANNKAMMDSSFLVLGGETDPFLTAREIMNLRDSTVDFYLDQKNRFPYLAILSACQTGLGRSMEAGVAGIARSFLLAGSHHVIMSLWNVDDESTAYLMNRFLSYLLNSTENYQPARALQLATIETKKKFPNPEQWASFSVFGVTENNGGY